MTNRLVFLHRLCGLALWVIAVPVLHLAETEARDDPPIASSEASTHVNTRCTIEMKVRASKDAKAHREYYLDSKENFRDPDNFAVVISYDHVESFQKAGIDNPADYYRGKTIRVTGTVIREAEQVRMRITDPSQIRVVSSDLKP